MRATKITKYFEVQQNKGFNFFPEKDKGVVVRDEPITTSRTLVKEPIGGSIFDTLTVKLNTHYYISAQKTNYTLEFINRNGLNTSSDIENVLSPVVGDLNALYQALKYIVYHPTVCHKLNKYKFIIYTNSEYILGIYSPSRELMESTLFFKIQSLLNCIKHISIEKLI